MKVKVSRRKWARGNMGRNGSALLIEEGPAKGKMCCLGFACVQLGIRKNTIQGRGMPQSIIVTPEPESYYGGTAASDKELAILKKSPLVRGRYNSALASKAASINDHPRLTEPQREKLLKDLFRSKGHSIVFVP